MSANGNGEVRTPPAAAKTSRLDVCVSFGYRRAIRRRSVKASERKAQLLVSGLEGASGSAIGPDGAIYVTEGAAGRITRVNPRTGSKTTFASGLPPAIIPIGGAIDVAFIGHTAYVLVTLVGSDLDPSSTNTVGIYRIDGPNHFTVVADIGAFSINNPPDEFDVPSGLQFAMEPIRHGFLVTDGHHNRVLRATLDGQVSEVIAFGNTVPTGLARRGKTVFMGEAGAIPHGATSSSRCHKATRRVMWPRLLPRHPTAEGC